MAQQLRIMATGTADTSAIRTETFRGRNYTVVPVIGLVEQVLQGLNASEPEFAPADEFAKFPVTWNGRPITMNHPRDNGQLCSANHPHVLEAYSFGFLANSEREDDRLKFEAWIDDEIVTEKGGEFQETVDRIMSGTELVEVSTGLFTEVVNDGGVHNGTRYKHRWQGVVPDHLAFLSVGTIGACSVESGCGAPRLNEEGQPIPNNGPAPAITAKPLNLGTPNAHGHGDDHSCCDSCANGGGCMSTNNQTPANGGDDAPPATVENSPGSGTGTEGDGGAPAVESGEPSPEDTPEGQEAAEGVVEGNADNVVTDVPPVNPEEAAEALQTMERQASALDRFVANAIPADFTFENARQVVQDALRAKYNRWIFIMAMTADTVAFESYDCCDYEGYMTLAVDYSVDSNGGVTFTGEPAPVNLIVKIVRKPEITDNAAVPGANQQQEDGTMADTPNGAPGAGGTTQENGAGSSPVPQTLEQFLASAPPEVALVVNEGINLRTQKKNDLITAITANSDVFSAEELQKKDIPELEKLATMSKPVTDYSGRAGMFGGNRVNGSGEGQRDNQRTVPVPPRVFGKKTDDAAAA